MSIDYTVFFVNELHDFFWSTNYANLREFRWSTNYTNLHELIETTNYDLSEEFGAGSYERATGEKRLSDWAMRRLSDGATKQWKIS